MVLATEVAEGFTRVGNEIRDLRRELGAGGWSFGPLANASARYKEKAQAAKVDPLKLLVLSDSTSDGYTGGLPGGSTRWQDVWPQRLAALLREQLKLKMGGTNWIPTKTPTIPNEYNYATATYAPPGKSLDDTNFNFGMPGGLWLQQGDANRVYDVTFPLKAGTTSVVVHTNGFYGTVLINGVGYSSNGDRMYTRILNPGSTLHVVGDTGIGFALFGITEYVGDEAVGVHMRNMSQSAIQAQQFLGFLQDTGKATRSAIQQYAPDVALILLGSNDIGAGRSAEEAMVALGGVGQELQGLVPDIELVYVIRPHAAGAIWADLSNRIVTGAGTIGAHVFDMQDVLPPVSDRSIWLSDSMHLNAAGDQLVAEELAKYLKVEKQEAPAGLTEEEVSAIADGRFAAKQKIVTNYPTAEEMVPGVLYLRVR